MPYYLEVATRETNRHYHTLVPKKERDLSNLKSEVSSWATAVWIPSGSGVRNLMDEWQYRKSSEKRSLQNILHMRHTLTLDKQAKHLNCKLSFNKLQVRLGKYFICPKTTVFLWMLAELEPSFSIHLSQQCRCHRTQNWLSFSTGYDINISI